MLLRRRSCTYAHVCSRIYIGYATEAAQLYESIDMNGDVATQAKPYFFK